VSDLRPPPPQIYVHLDSTSIIFTQDLLQFGVKKTPFPKEIANRGFTVLSDI
jgi:hypothetical protein